MTDVLKVAESMIGALNADLTDDGRLGLVRNYLRGKHRLAYMPKGAKAEFRHTAEKSVTNWLPLVSDIYSDSLHVDGYRAAKSAENSKAWDYWQANGLDARQSIAIRGALEHGAAYVLVLPSRGKAPVIKPLAALRSYALYEDDDDDYPTFFLYKVGASALGDTLFDLYDDTNVYRLRVPKDGGTMVVASTDAHGMPVVPVVRFRDRLDGEATGIIAPLITLQDRVNEVVFTLMIALQYASFRQRWATGLVVPLDEDETLPDGSPNPNFGKPVEPFEAAVNRLWVSDSADTKFGDFAQTETSGHLLTYESTVRTLAALAQISPNILTGDLINLSADALAQMESSTQRRIGAYETIFGEAWEQVFMLAAIAAGDPLDDSAEVRWRDTEARSMESIAKALSILVTDLKVPAEELWEKIPTATDQDVRRWKEAAAKPDTAALLATALTRTAESTVPAAPATFAPAAAPV
jgi:hypothetical protein